MAHIPSGTNVPDSPRTQKRTRPQTLRLTASRHRASTLRTDNVIPFPGTSTPNNPRTWTDRARFSAPAEPSSTGAHSTVGILMPAVALPSPLSGYRPQDVGVLTHALIAILTPQLPTLTEVTLVERIHDVAGALVDGDNVNRRRTLVATAAGRAATYLRCLAPAEPWELQGCEFDTGAGRVDVAWRSRGTGAVLFDENKTTNRPLTALSREWLDQCTRYARAGAEHYGHAFCGVRLLAIGSLHSSVLVLPDATTVSLVPTRTQPLQTKEQVINR